MKKSLNLQKLLSNQFLKGSIVMLAASNITNISQFAFHFLSGRFLGKVYYGDLAAIISIIGIISIVQSAFGLAIVKSITAQDERKVGNFIKWVDIYSLIMGAVIALLFLALAPVINSFLNISQPLVIYLLVPIIFLFIALGSLRSILQGLLNFNKYALSILTESAGKIITVIFFLLLGWQIFGALGAILVGVLTSFIFTRWSLAAYLRGSRQERPNLSAFAKYSSLTFIQGVSLTSMYSADLLLVKHFFPSEQAGIYASLSVLGRVVFFGANPIVHVMFPLISKNYSMGEKYLKIFNLSILLVLLISLFITLLFYLFPNLAINLLYGSGYLEGASILWLFGIFMTLLSLAMLLTQFYLSINKQKIILLFACSAILQIILISLFHQSLTQVIHMSIISTALLDILLLVYFFWQKNKS